MVAAGIDVTLIFIVVLGTVAVLWMLSFIVNPTTPIEHVDGQAGPPDRLASSSTATS